MSASYMLYTTDYAVREKQLVIIEERKPVSNVSEKHCLFMYRRDFCGNPIICKKATILCSPTTTKNMLANQLTEFTFFYLSFVCPKKKCKVESTWEPSQTHQIARRNLQLNGLRSYQLTRSRRFNE